MSIRPRVYRRIIYPPFGPELWGVVKLFDLGGKVVDATPYFGGSRLRFGRDYTPYLLASAALVTPRRVIPFDFNWHWQPVPEGATLEIGRFDLTGA